MVVQNVLRDELVKWRRHLHENPELSFQEVKTSECVYNTLQSFPGLKVTRPTKTSVLAVLKGTKVSDEKAHTIAFRADMDALPIEEEADVEFPSKNKGIMHACGHDAHTAMLLGAAKILSQKQTEINGEIRFIFQHAEELPPGGAVQLVEKGVVDHVDYIFALHVYPGEQVGKITLKKGVITAANNDFEVKIVGCGGHAANPELTIDPLMIGAEVVTNIQQIVSRKVPALKAPVISITKFNGGNTLNVIPDVVEFGGTIRSLDSDIRLKCKNYVNQIVKGITEAHGASYEITWDDGYAAVVNDKEAYKISKTVAERVFGDENITHLEEPFFFGEDFSAFSELVPSSFQFIGVHDDHFGKPYPLHHPKFKMSEDVLSYGVNYFVEIANELCCK